MSEKISGAVVRLREDADGWRRVDGPRLSPEEPFLTGLDEEAAERLVQSNWALQRSSVDEVEAFRGAGGSEDEPDEGDADAATEDAAAAPLDPSDHTLDELEDALDDVDDVDTLEAIEAAEHDGKNREGAQDLFDERRAELTDSEAE